MTASHLDRWRDPDDDAVMKRLLLSTLLIASFAGSPSPTTAAQATTELQVRVTVASTCDVSVLGASALDFGTVQSTAANVAATAQLQVRCTNGTPYSVALDLGDNASGGMRRMVNGSNYLPYGLYRSADTSQPWTDQPTERHSGSGSGATQTISVYGVLPGANAPAGAYVDTVTATLTY